MATVPTKHIGRAFKAFSPDNDRPFICERIPSRFHLLSLGYLAAQASYRFNQTCVAVLIVYFAASASIWSLISLMDLVTAHPYCSTIYGRPDSNDCRRILNGLISSRPERGAVHCFAPAGSEHPDDVTNPQWVNRVDIPKFWTRGDSPNCRVALFPVENSSDGSLSYDISRYLGIQSVGLGISHYCVEALGIPGLQGTGGIDATGDNRKLRIILYAPLSKFENDTLADYKNNKPIAIQEDTDDEYEAGPTDPTPPQKRPRTGGMGLMTSRGLQTTTRNLGDGWYMTYGLTTSIIPAQIGAANLEAFYTQVVTSAANQISTTVNTTENLAFSFKGLNLRLSSSAPISWTWVINFAADMLDNVSTDFAVLFSGEAYSAYWEIAAVTAVLTLV